MTSELEEMGKKLAGINFWGVKIQSVSEETDRQGDVDT